MFEYRISKYDPRFRVNGIYTRGDWSALCDVGKIYNGRRLTMGEYTAVISNYANCVMAIADAAQAHEFTVSDVEVYDKKYKKIFRLRNGEVVSRQRLRFIIMGCIEERVWCRLSAENAYIHFRYDLYVSIGCELDCATVRRICAEYGLFAEAFA